MKLSRTTSAKVNPDEVIWPQYCLGHIPCPYTVAHGSHFWMHFSGYPAVCEGRSPAASLGDGQHE